MKSARELYYLENIPICLFLDLLFLLHDCCHIFLLPSPESNPLLFISVFFFSCPQAQNIHFFGRMAGYLGKLRSICVWRLPLYFSKIAYYVLVHSLKSRPSFNVNSLNIQNTPIITQTKATFVPDVFIFKIKSKTVKWLEESPSENQNLSTL